MTRPSRLLGRATALAMLVAALVLVVLAAAGAAQAQPARPVEAQPRAGALREDPHAGHDHAQPGASHEGHDHARPGAGPEAAAADQGHGGEGGEGFGNGKGAAFLFWLLALTTVGGSLFVITRRNLIAAVMGMVGTFFALAALYAMLYAHFLAVIQILVYAGAIMVLFVFVVMILNRPEDEPWALQGLLGKALAGLAILYLLIRVSGVLWSVKDTPHAVVAGPRPTVVDPTHVGVLETPAQAAQRVDDWGSTRAVGKALFREYLFPFEAVSLVLLVAVVGGITLSRPHRAEEAEGAGEGRGAGDPGSKV